MEETKVMEKPKNKKVFWKFLGIWCAVLAVVLALALAWFYHFLGDYQRVYEASRPLLYLEELMPLFESRDGSAILAQARAPELSPFEGEDRYGKFLEGYLAGKTLGYGTKAGEHIEERPVYVITADEEPFAVVRLKKREETAAYGLPRWRTDSIELLPRENRERYLVCPATVSAQVNGVAVGEESLVERGLPSEAQRYLGEYTTVPTYNRYELGKLYTDPEVAGVNPAGEAVEITYNEKTGCYTADFGADPAQLEEMGDFAVQMVRDYAMYISNDAPYNALDKYFPAGSKLLVGIKSNARQFYDAHYRPEIKNEELRGFTTYSDSAFSARVYLEQYMFVPYSGKTRQVNTDITVYFVKLDGGWKVAGIPF